MFNVCGRNIDEIRPICADVQPGQIADDFAPFMANRKAVAQYRNFPGKAGKSGHGHRHQDGKTQP
jgi:hypothetical protein